MYISARNSVTITCEKHGDFSQAARKHIAGQGCPKCARERKSLTTEGFVKKAKRVHGNKYDYSLVKYTNIKTPVEIVCPAHGSFFQVPEVHLRPTNCPKCTGRHEHDCVYCWNVSGTDHYKIGISREAILSSRVSKSANSLGVKATSIIYKVLDNPAEVEKQLHLLFKNNREEGYLGDGYTEIFKLNKEELNYVERLLS